MVCGLALLAGLAVPGLAGNPQPSEAEADIELRTVNRQLEQARQQEEAMAGKLTELESEAAAVSRSLAETAARIQSREAMVTSAEEHLRRLEEDGRRLPLALDVGQLLDEVADVVCVPLVEPERPILSLQIPKMPLGCLANIFAVLLPALCTGAEFCLLLSLLKDRISHTSR